MSVVDREGVVRFKQAGVHYGRFAKKERHEAFVAFLDEHTIYSDANATIPKVFLFFREKMLDLTGMQTKEQLLSIVDLETEMLGEEEVWLAVAYQ
ncbi:hypothetical protein D1872_257310 [compost metagenome]